MYDHDDWRALSRRLAIQPLNRKLVRFSRPLLISSALVLIVVGVLQLLGVA